LSRMHATPTNIHVTATSANVVALNSRTAPTNVKATRHLRTRHRQTEHDAARREYCNDRTVRSADQRRTRNA
jgi:hypothetical protein